MDRRCRIFAFSRSRGPGFAWRAACSTVALAAGCAGPPIPAPIDGIPVCPDFTTGNAKMEGGLHYPVRLRVLDGKTVLFKTIIAGLRRADEPKPRSFIADDNARYTVEWAQCANPRAPRSVSEAAQTVKAKDKVREGEGTAYECGEVMVYKADAVLDTKKGDKASHVINFVAPPDGSCWAPDPTPPPVERDAGADAAARSADAGPAATDAGSAGDAGAGEAAAPAPANHADAGPKK